MVVQLVDLVRIQVAQSHREHIQSLHDRRDQRQFGVDDVDFVWFVALQQQNFVALHVVFVVNARERFDLALDEVHEVEHVH